LFFFLSIHPSQHTWVLIFIFLNQAFEVERSKYFSTYIVKHQQERTDPKDHTFLQWICPTKAGQGIGYDVHLTTQTMQK